MVRLTTILITLAVVQLNTLEGFGADIHKGLDAAERGDYATALGEWRTLAEQGDAIAQYNLGMMYRKGEGVLKDDKEAVKWFRISAEQGDPRSQTYLGVMYGEGMGVAKDNEEALKWYRLAAEQGFAGAMGNLGVMYAKGDGVLMNYVEAYKWGNLAAANGNEKGRKLRDIVEKTMTPSQIKMAKYLARECAKNNYKDC